MSTKHTYPLFQRKKLFWSNRAVGYANIFKNTKKLRESIALFVGFTVL